MKTEVQVKLIEYNQRKLYATEINTSMSTDLYLNG